MHGSMFRGLDLHFLVLLAFVTTACASFATAADRALIVGVGDHVQEGWSPLGPAIALDVDMMQEVAERLGFEAIDTLLDQEATYDGFKDRFERLINGTRAGDRVLLYFSGRGCVKDEGLPLYDTRIRGDTMENALRDDEFHALLQRLSGRHVLVLIDACNACSMGSMDSGNRENVAFLAAAEDHEWPLMKKDEGSLFTLGLYDAIDDATSEQESLNLVRLRERVAGFIQRSIDSGDVQGSVHHPKLWGGTDFPLSHATDHPARAGSNR